MHWTARRGKYIWQLGAFEIGMLILGAAGIGVSAATAPRPRQPRETEMEKEIQRRSRLFTQVRLRREGRQKATQQARGAAKLLDRIRVRSPDEGMLQDREKRRTELMEGLG